MITTNQLVGVVTSKHQVDAIGETRQVYFTANGDAILIGKSCVPLGAELHPEARLCHFRVTLNIAKEAVDPASKCHGLIGREAVA